MEEWQAQPYGLWPSPLAATDVARAAVRLMWLRSAGEDLFWVESRPVEQGRQVIVRRTPDGVIRDVTPTGYSARTRVHEYGGVPYVLAPGVLYFTNETDQRIYRQVLDTDEVVGITAGPGQAREARYADMCLTPDQQWLIAVRELHLPRGVVRNEIVAVHTEGSAEHVLVAGRDFVATPRLSPDGSTLAWLAWDRPAMPWDGAELWTGAFGPQRLNGAHQVAGGGGTSVFQPEWSPQGSLHFAWDRSGWWNLYRLPEGQKGEAELVLGMDCDFGEPLWQLGLNTFAFFPDGSLACRWISEGRHRLGTLRCAGGDIVELDVPFTAIESLQTHGRRRVVALTASPVASQAVSLIDLDQNGVARTLCTQAPVPIRADKISIPEQVAFPTTAGDVAYGNLYAPRDSVLPARANERPPLVVICHGGPTGLALPILSPVVQFWTTRGFAVIDVNYRGSSGYGRSYRDRIKGMWGVYDVEDCVAAVEFLVGSGRVDATRVVIRGSSAGGWTTLCALARSTSFAAGGSTCGVADAALLAAQTHKFESRYLDGLLGPLPEALELYNERSPLFSAHSITAPLILIQGLDDKVAPPNQAQLMVDALRRRGVPHAYLGYQREGHGLRGAENIAHALEAELHFYRQAFGLGSSG